MVFLIRILFFTENAFYAILDMLRKTLDDHRMLYFRGPGFCRAFLVRERHLILKERANETHLPVLRVLW